MSQLLETEWFYGFYVQTLYCEGWYHENWKTAIGLLSAVLGSFRSDLKLSTALPQKVKTEPYIPSDDAIRKILDYAKGTEYKIPWSIPAKDIMRFGSWETDYVMKGVYRHAMEDKNKDAQRAAASKLGNTLFS